LIRSIELFHLSQKIQILIVKIRVNHFQKPTILPLAKPSKSCASLSTVILTAKNPDHGQIVDEYSKSIFKY